MSLILDKRQPQQNTAGKRIDGVPRSDLCEQSLALLTNPTFPAFLGWGVVCFGRGDIGGCEPSKPRQSPPHRRTGFRTVSPQLRSVGAANSQTRCRVRIIRRWEQSTEVAPVGPGRCQSCTAGCLLCSDTVHSGTSCIFMCVFGAFMSQVYKTHFIDLTNESNLQTVSPNGTHW